MKYIVYYVTDSNKKLFERVEAVSKAEAKRKVLNKWNDVDYIDHIEEIG